MNIQNTTVQTIGIKNGCIPSPKIRSTIKPERNGSCQGIGWWVSSRRKIGCLVCIDLKSSTKFTVSYTTISADFLNIMSVWIEWTIVLDPVTARLIKGPVSNHVGILGNFFLNVSNRHGTRCRTQAIRISCRIGGNRYRYRAGPWITTHLKGVISVGNLRKTTTDNFPIGYGKIREGESAYCTRSDRGPLRNCRLTVSVYLPDTAGAMKYGAVRSPPN